MTVYVRRPRRTVDVYTDGACHEGHGGWAWESLDVWEAGSGYEANSTNQRMELRAALEAVQALGPRYRIRLHSDSAYLINCFKDGWYHKWTADGRKGPRSTTKVANWDLWEPLIEAVLKYRVRFVKVKGHSGIYGNERVDKEAVKQRLQGAASRGTVGT